MNKTPQTQQAWFNQLDILPHEGCSLIWEGGSRAYALNQPGSDHDIRAVAMPTLGQLALQSDWGERHMPDTDFVVRSANKTLHMLRNGNPNLVELFGLPKDCFIYMDSWGLRLLVIGKRLCLTTNLVKSFSGYAIQQKRLAEKNTGAKRDKALMHSLRVWRMGRELIETGTVNVRRTSDHMELMAIRQGDYDPRWYENAWRIAQHAYYKAVDTHNVLPKPVTDDEYRQLVEPLMLDWMRHLIQENNQ